MAWWAAWLGWTLDAFDFTIFLLIMVPIAQEFHVPLTAVTAVFAITLWMRLVGAVASGWLADRVGRKIPLMISILWYSICNFIAGFSPTFAFLFFFRALLGIGMGAEWPAGMALAMETWPARSRGLMASSFKARGHRLPDVLGLLWAVLQFRRLARLPVGRDPAGAGGFLGPQIRQRAGSLAGEPSEATRSRIARCTCHCWPSSSGATSSTR